MNHHQFQNNLKRIIIAIYIVFFSLVFVAIPLGVILLAGLTTYLLFSFFTHSVPKDKIAWILFGGKPVGQVGPGFHLVLSGIFKLEIVEKKFQIKLGPFDVSRTATEFRSRLLPITLTTNPADTAEALERVLTFTPTLVLNVKIMNLAALATAGGVEEAIDLVSETIGAGLQSAIGGMTLKEVLARRADIIELLNLTVRPELESMGVHPDGSIKFESLGIPPAITAAAEKAATAVSDAQTARTAGAAAADVRRQAAEARQKEMEAEAKGKEALGLAEAAAISAKVAALPGTDELKTQILVAEKTGLPVLPPGLTFLTLNQGGGKEDPTATIVAATAAAVKATTPPTTPKDEKKDKK